MIEMSYEDRAKNIMNAVARAQPLIVDTSDIARKAIRLGSEDFSSTLTLDEASAFLKVLEIETAKLEADGVSSLEIWIASIRDEIARQRNAA